MFNEIITLCALYLMMCFSDFVGYPETRSFCGIAFISVICLYAANHILFLVINVCMQVRHLIRVKYCAYRNKKMLAKMKAVRSHTLKGPQSENMGSVEAKMGNSKLLGLRKGAAVTVKTKAKYSMAQDWDERAELERIPEAVDGQLEVS